MESKDSGPVPDCKQSRNERIEGFLQEWYAFRWNTVKSRTEYRAAGVAGSAVSGRATDKTTGGAFMPVTKFCLNSIRRELDRTTGINTSAENIRAILESDFAERVNPVQSYFRGLPKTTGREAITRLAATVAVRNPEHWTEYLTKWLMGVAANALCDTGCKNHVCLVLTGEQGRFKTTWLDNLVC